MQENILVIESLSLVNIPATWILLHKRKIDKIYLLNSPSGRIMKFISKNLLPVNTFKDFKEISYPEAVGKAGEKSIKITELIWNNWLGNNRFVELSSLAFFNDTNITYSFKRHLTFYVENNLVIYYKLLNLASEKEKSVIFVPKDQDSFDLLELCSKNSSSVLRNKHLGEFAKNPPLVLQNESSNEFAKHSSSTNLTIISFNKILNFLYNTHKFFVSSLYPFFLILLIIKNRGIYFKKVEKKLYKIASSNIFGVKTQGSYPNDIFFVDGLNFNKKDTIIILKKKLKDLIRNIEEYSIGGINTVNPDELKVPIIYLLKLPLRLIKTCFFSCMINSKKFRNYFRSMLFYQIYKSISWELLMEYYHFNIIWSNEDNWFEDEIVTVIACKNKIKHVLIPHFLLSKTGCVSAYLYYTHIFCSGQYLPDAHNKTWNKHSNIIITGIPMNDQLKLKDSQLASENTQKLIKNLKKNNKIISVFTGSYQGEKHSEDRYFKMVKMCKKIIEMHKNVCIVLKPKIKKNYFKAINMFKENPNFIKLINSIPKNKFFIIDPKEGCECSATYLMKNSNLTISMAGDAYPLSSVWAEALMMNKPSFAYNPPFVDLPLLKEFKGTLIFSEEKEIINAVNNVFKGTWKMPNKERLKYLFDPYCDGKAIERIIEKMKEICDKNEL